MSKAILTLTRGGVALGNRLHEILSDSVLYVPEKFYEEGSNAKKIQIPLMTIVGEIFQQYECLIFIMATGIVVRSIAPYIQDKKTDPAVIVLDEKGQNVISLLSGHMGGANRYTLEIAKRLNANPVITTASDVNNRMAVDTLAENLGCEIENYKDATNVTAHIVNGEKVGVVSHIPIGMNGLAPMILMDDEKIKAENPAGVIYITEKRIEDDLYCDRVILRPKNIILGIGCKKGKSKEEILHAIVQIIDELQISLKSIKHIATVDVKKDEAGLIEAARELKVPLKIVERERIKEVEHSYPGSDFVKSQIGVGAVCEPVAMLTCHQGVWLKGKTTYDGVTIAVVREGGHEHGNSGCWNQL